MFHETHDGCELWILLTVTLVIGGLVYVKHPALPGQALQNSGKSIGGVWRELLLGFIAQQYEQMARIGLM